MTGLVLYTKAGDLLVAHGRPPIFSSEFVIGTTRPTPQNTGVPGTTVLRTASQAGLPTASNGDIVIDDAYHAANARTMAVPVYSVTGTILTTVNRLTLLIDEVDLFGFVKVRTQHFVWVRRSRVRGSGPVTGLVNTGLIDANHGNVGRGGYANVLVEQCTLIPDFPSTGISGILGHDFTARRCLVRNTVDHFGIYNVTRRADPVRVTIEGCYGDSLSYFSPDPNHADDDDRSHCDSIQGQGGTDVVIRGNDLRAQPSATAGNGYSPTDPTAPSKNTYAPASVTGQVIGLTPNVSTISGWVIERNWFIGGRAGVVAKPAAFSVTDIVMRDNRFDRTQPLITTAASGAKRRAVILAPGVSFVGAPTVTGPDTQGNVYDDDGTPITIYREAA